MKDPTEFGISTDKIPLSEQEFVKELKSGSEAAFNRLITENQTKVYRIALSVVKNQADAEDIAQEVFIRIYTSINNFKGNSSLSTWIYKITYNRAIDFVKKNNKKIKTTKTLDDPEDAELLTISGEKFMYVCSIL